MTVSLGDLITLRSEEGKDRVDNVLLQLIVGLELRALGEHTALSSILPILVGPQRQVRPFPIVLLSDLDRFHFDLLSLEPSAMTNNRPDDILDKLGAGNTHFGAKGKPFRNSTWMDSMLDPSEHFVGGEVLRSFPPNNADLHLC
jgi:hypothetical protein